MTVTFALVSVAHLTLRDAGHVSESLWSFRFSISPCRKPLQSARRPQATFRTEARFNSCYRLEIECILQPGILVQYNLGNPAVH
jgi:hypothetical protein